MSGVVCVVLLQMMKNIHVDLALLVSSEVLPSSLPALLYPPKPIPLPLSFFDFFFPQVRVVL